MTYLPTYIKTVLVAVASLCPAAHLFAESDFGQKARMVSILNIDQIPGMQRSEIINADGNEIDWVAALDTLQVLLYAQDIFFPDDAVVRSPILDAKGSHVNLRDWMQARGTATATCVRGGTRYDFKFENLIPDGVYTIWHFPDTGAGALATTSFDDVDNVFHASKFGKANFSVVAEPGPMTFGGVMPSCSVTQSIQEQLVVLYHIDNQYCGPFPCNTPGNPAVEVAHLLFKR